MAVINGDDQANTLQTTQDGDTVNGRGGDDTLTNSHASYTILNGGAGDDILKDINIAGGLNILNGESGNDAIYVQASDDVSGGAGDDVIHVQTSLPVSLTGGAGIDTVRFETSVTLADFSRANGFEFYWFGSGAVAGTPRADNIDFGGLQAVAGSHDPSFDLREGDDRFVGTSLKDRVDGGVGDDILNGGAGDDTLVDHYGANLLIGGDGNDLIQIGGSPTDPAERETVFGGAGDDRVSAGESGVLIAYGGDGNDSIQIDSSQSVSRIGGFEHVGVSGFDQALHGTDDADNLALSGAVFDTSVSLSPPLVQLLGGDDRYWGATGADAVSGGDGGDVLIGGTGDDVLQGDAGNDTLECGVGNDSLEGGEGRDTARYGSSTSAVSVSLQIAGEQDTHGDGLDTLSGIENLVGSAFGDTLTGDDHSNVLVGAAGNDTLSGGGGWDVLIGGLGKDTLSGGAGADRFLFRAVDLSSNPYDNIDRITDFHHAEHDKIDLSQLIEGDLVYLGSGGLATTGAGQVSAAPFDGGTAVQVDVDGDGRANLTIWVLGETLGASDFIL